MKPEKEMSLVGYDVTNGDDNILMVSKHGKAIQFKEEDIRVMGRGAAGVRGMRIR